MNDGSIGSTFNEGHMTVEGEDAFCVDINTNFRNGYKTRADASTRMSYDQISDVALSIEYVNQYVQSHSGLSSQHIYFLKQCVVWQRLSVHLGWQCDNVRASYDEIPKAITLGRKPLPARTRDAMNVAVISTLARDRTLDSSGRNLP